MFGDRKSRPWAPPGCGGQLLRISNRRRSSASVYRRGGGAEGLPRHRRMKSTVPAMCSTPGPPNSRSDHQTWFQDAHIDHRTDRHLHESPGWVHWIHRGPSGRSKPGFHAGGDAIGSRESRPADPRGKPCPGRGAAERPRHPSGAAPNSGCVKCRTWFRMSRIRRARPSKLPA